MAAAKVRLYLDHPLGVGQTVPLAREQAHYLFNVMRLKKSDYLYVFNGREGEFLAQVAESAKRSGALVCVEQTRPLQMPPDLWLLFAPVKKSRTDFIVEKATEMGARRIVPVLTDYTNSERVRRDKMHAHVVEAAEQCGSTFVPEVGDPIKLANFLGDWPDDRQLLFCDESMVSTKSDLGAENGKSWAILVGPEGGFSPKERDEIRDLPFAVPISLGPRVLRADTAVVSAMTLWQSHLGDW